MVDSYSGSTLCGFWLNIATINFNAYILIQASVSQLSYRSNKWNVWMGFPKSVHVSVAEIKLHDIWFLGQYLGSGYRMEIRYFYVLTFAMQNIMQIKTMHYVSLIIWICVYLILSIQGDTKYTVKSILLLCFC